MKAHVEKGAALVRRMLDELQLHDAPGVETLQAAVDFHHEYLDGSGYPNGLGGHEIPLVARMVTTADIFDALTHYRPYKRPWRVDDAYEHLSGLAGEKLDRDCVSAMKSARLRIVETIRRFERRGAGSSGGKEARLSESTSKTEPRVMSLRLRDAGRAAFLDALEAYAADVGLDQPLWIERFRHAAGQTYDEFAGLKNRQGFESLVGLTASSISLVHEDELSFSLELSTFVRKLREACMPQLGVLHRLYLVLLDQKDMPIEQCPVGPDAVARALRALIEAVGLDAEQRQRLLERSLAALGTRLQTLYAELIRMFEEVGVAPRPLGFGSAVRGPQETAAGFGQVRPIPQEGTGGGLAALQERLRKKRQSAAPDAVAIDPELAARNSRGRFASGC